MEQLIPLIVMGLTVCIVIPIVVFASVNMMSNPGKLLKEDPEIGRRFMRTLPRPFLDWLERYECEFVGSYRFMNTQLAAWVIPDTATHVVAYLASGRFVFDFDTEFGRHKGLCTSTSNSIGMFPFGPGVYKESIRTRDFDELYAAHYRSLEVLAQHKGLTPEFSGLSYAESMVEGVSDQMAHVKTIPLWPVKSIYWFFVQRARLKNKTVEQQLKLGLVR